MQEEKIAFAEERVERLRRHAHCVDRGWRKLAPKTSALVFGSNGITGIGFYEWLKVLPSSEQGD
jgi:hypothetical protein